MTDDDIQQLSMIEQTLSSIIQQRQSYNKQLLEVKSALKELESVDEAYHIVGSVMIKKDSSSLRKDLEEQKTAQEIRLKSLENQEAKLRENAKSLQEKVVADLEKK